MVSVSWQGVVVVVAFVAGAVASAALGNAALAMVLAGAAGGMLLASPLQVRQDKG